MIYNKIRRTLIGGTCIAVITATGCGKKEKKNSDNTESVADVIAAGGLALLPSMSGLIAANPDASLALADSDAPIVKELTNSLTDKYFFDNSVAALNAVADQNAWNNLSSAAKAKIRGDFRSTDGYAGGEGACRMMQQTGQAVDQIIQSGTTSCFLKEIPSAAAGGTWTKSDGSALENPKSAFSQTENDKITRVHIKNFSENGQTMSFYVFAKISGRNTVGSGKYKAQLYFCNDLTGTPMAGDEGPGGLPSFEVDTTTGVFTASEANSNYSAVVTSSIKVGSDGKLAFDLTKERKAESKSSYQGQTSKNGFTITPDNQVINREFNEGSGFSNKNYSLARITGNGTQNLRFIEGAYKGEGTQNSFSFNYSGAAKFEAFYKADSNHPYISALPSSLSSDTFYATPTITAPDLSGFKCDATPDIIGEADFSVTEMKAVAESCNGGRIGNTDSFWEMCRQAETSKLQYVWSDN
jgi:hypothetical protein